MSPVLTPLRAEIAVWLLVCGGLAAGIGAETEWGRQWQLPATELAPAAAEFAKPALTSPYWLPAADQFLEVAMRPIFVVSRRPAPPMPPPEPPKPTMKKDQFVLTGVTMLPEGKFAFLLDKNDKKTKVVTAGKEINGIKVVEISPDRVVLHQFDDQEILLLKTAKAPTPPGVDYATSRPGQPIPPAIAQPSAPPVLTTAPPAAGAPAGARPGASPVPPVRPVAGPVAGPAPAATE